MHYDNRKLSRPELGVPQRATDFLHLSVYRFAACLVLKQRRYRTRTSVAVSHGHGLIAAVSNHKAYSSRRFSCSRSLRQLVKRLAECSSTWVMSPQILCWRCALVLINRNELQYHLPQKGLGSQKLTFQILVVNISPPFTS